MMNTLLVTGLTASATGFDQTPNLVGAGWSLFGFDPHPAHDPDTDWTRRLIKDSVSNQHHDMIFAVVVNRFGLVGGLAMLGLYLVWIAGALLAFTLSVDEFIIAFFTAGSGRDSITLPMQIFAMIRFGVTPEINALAAIVMTFSVVVLAASQRVNRGRLPGQ